MGISLNPLSALFNYIKNKREREMQIASFLDDVAQEACEVAKIWQKTVEMLNDTKELDVYEVPGAKALVKTQQAANLEQYSRLSRFHQNISRVLGKNHHSQVDPIVFHIGKVLNERNLSKRNVENYFSGIRSVVTFDDSNSLQTLKTLNESVETMHKEAAALYVLAKTFRANIQ